MKTKNQKKGMTLVELLVAMTIFTTATTIAIGSFVAVSRIRMVTLNMKETQQKVRITLEMINRYARQADRVSVRPGELGEADKRVYMIFKESSLTERYGASFLIGTDGDNKGKIIYFNCSGSLINLATVDYCSDWGTGIAILGGRTVRVNNTSYFKLNSDIKANGNTISPISGSTNGGYYDSPTLLTSLESYVGSNSGSDPYYNSDYFKIISKVILENVK